MNIDTLKTFVLCDHPRVCCKEHRVHSCRVPFATQGSNLTNDFSEYLAYLSMHLSKTYLSEFVNVKFETVDNAIHRAYEKIKSLQNFDELIKIGIDETSYKKGYEYITTVINHDTKAVIWASKGYGKTVLQKFFDLLTCEQKASIQFVTADGANYIKGNL
jgi:transposase